MLYLFYIWVKINQIKVQHEKAFICEPLQPDLRRYSFHSRSGNSSHVGRVLVVPAGWIFLSPCPASTTRSDRRHHLSRTFYEPTNAQSLKPYVFITNRFLLSGQSLQSFKVTERAERMTITSTHTFYGLQLWFMFQSKLFGARWVLLRRDPKINLTNKQQHTQRETHALKSINCSAENIGWHHDVTRRWGMNFDSAFNIHQDIQHVKDLFWVYILLLLYHHTLGRVNKTFHNVPGIAPSFNQTIKL